MQTNFSEELLSQPYGKTADKIIRSCVHCGFCLATCPTYELLGNELDSPRGRIYQIKNALEGGQVSYQSLSHLDRCLTCRSCETTCPSGVEYGHLLDIGREFIEQKKLRPIWQRLPRFVLRKLLTSHTLFNSLYRFKTILKPIKAKPLVLIDNNRKIKGKVLILSGCVQPAISPQINQSTKNVLTKLGYEVLETSQSNCCGAINHHLSATQNALAQIKQNIDTWLPQVNNGVEAIISTASGCGVMLKDYPHLLKDDSEYANKAKQLNKVVMDIAEFISQQDLSNFKLTPKKITFHAPCTLQHGLKLNDVVENILSDLGFTLNPVKDAHLCCGSAGTYSIFQPKISKQLRTNKLQNLLKDEPELIVSANISCLEHLQKGTKTPLMHWIELLDKN